MDDQNQSKDALHLLSDKALNDLQHKAQAQCAKLLGCDQTLPPSEARRRSAALLVELEEFAAHMRGQFFSNEKSKIVSSDWLLESVC